MRYTQASSNYLHAIISDALYAQMPDESHIQRAYNSNIHYKVSHVISIEYVLCIGRLLGWY